MKRTRQLFWIALGVLLWAAGCGPPERFTLFQEEVGGLDLSLEYPSEWQLNRQPDGLTIVSKPVEEETAVSDATIITIRTLPASTLLVEDLTQLMRIEVNALRSQQPLNLQGEITPITVNDQEGVTAVLESSDGATKQYTILRTDTTLVLIFTEIGAGVVESHTPLAERTVNSITAASLVQ